MKVPLVDLKGQYQSIKEDIDGAISRVVTRTSFIMGEEVSSLEKEFAAFCHTSYAVGTSSGTSALQLALVSLGIGDGDEVITTPFTFIATTESILESGAKPVFVDIEEDTFNLDASKIEAAITGKTKAIIPVHLYGHPADMDPLMAIAKKHKLAVIEDACQAHGALYKERPVGSIGDAGCFSFYPGKNLGCYGDGGMLVTNNKTLYEKAAKLRDHGRSDKYTHIMHGYNFRLDAMQAAIVKAKLKHLNGWNDARRKNAAIYNSCLDGTEGVVTPVEKEYARHVYHLYVIKIRGRDKLKAFLKENGVDSGVHYPIPLHKQPVYIDMKLCAAKLPVSERCSNEILSLPMYPELSEADIRAICGLIKKFVKG